MGSRPASTLADVVVGLRVVYCPNLHSLTCVDDSLALLTRECTAMGSSLVEVGGVFRTSDALSVVGMGSQVAVPLRVDDVRCCARVEELLNSY